MVRVVRVIDGDTIEIAWHDDIIRVRYIGVNTPERNEDCFDDATAANANLVEGQIVRLFSDTSDTDQFDRDDPAAEADNRARWKQIHKTQRAKYKHRRDNEGG
jgi:hypothetical protein